MKEITLKGGSIAYVDDKDFEYLSKFKWCVSNRYASGTKDGKSFKMHREILKDELTSNKLYVDHIDHNPLNNQRSNLRVCTNSQNQANRIKTERKTSSFKGVSWHNGANKWHARIYYNSRPLSLGLFNSEISAAIAYDEKALELFGEFALVNFPIEEAK